MTTNDRLNSPTQALIKHARNMLYLCLLVIVVCVGITIWRGNPFVYPYVRLTLMCLSFIPTFSAASYALNILLCGKTTYEESFTEDMPLSLKVQIPVPSNIPFTLMFLVRNKASVGVVEGRLKALDASSEKLLADFILVDKNITHRKVAMFSIPKGVQSDRISMTLELDWSKMALKGNMAKPQDRFKFDIIVRKHQTR